MRQYLGGRAASYDRYRPSYPSAAIDVLVERTPTLAIDVGCGTGKAARLVSERGVRVIGVEPDVRMAEVAAHSGVDVTVSALEEWAPVECDLMYAAQSWHWVEPGRGADVAAGSVRRGGRWAAFWNYESDAELTRCRDAVYRRLAPHLVDQIVSTDDEDLRRPVLQGLEATGAFSPVEIHDVSWIDHLTVDDAVQRLASHSSHRLLDESVAMAVDKDLQRELGEPTDMIDLSYITRIFVADRIQSQPTASGVRRRWSR